MQGVTKNKFYCSRLKIGNYINSQLYDLIYEDWPETGSKIISKTCVNTKECLILNVKRLLQVKTPEGQNNFSIWLFRIFLRNFIFLFVSNQMQTRVSFPLRFRENKTANNRHQQHPGSTTVILTNTVAAVPRLMTDLMVVIIHQPSIYFRQI